MCKQHSRHQLLRGLFLGGTALTTPEFTLDTFSVDSDGYEGSLQHFIMAHMDIMYMKGHDFSEYRYCNVLAGSSLRPFKETRRNNYGK
jgi:hypothetical protein